jgi:hypothetical protein
MWPDDRSPPWTPAVEAWWKRRLRQYLAEVRDNEANSDKYRVPLRDERPKARVAAAQRCPRKNRVYRRRRCAVAPPS